MPRLPLIALLPALLASCGDDELAPRSPQGVPTGDTPPVQEPEVDPNSLFVFAHSAWELYRIQPETLETERVGAFDADLGWDGMHDIALDRKGRMFGVSPTDLYLIDPATAACTHLASLALSLNSLSVLSSVSGVELLVGASVNDGTVYRIDLGSGAATPLGAFGQGMTSSGDMVSVTGFGTLATVVLPPYENDWLVSVNPIDGTASYVGDTGVGDLWGLGFWGGRLYGFAADGGFYDLDVRTGAASLIETGGVAWWGAGVLTSAPTD